MWLDRFAQSHSPAPSQGGNRSYSPLPRRTTSSLSPYVTSQRPGTTPRGSSTSLISNNSSASLLSAARKPNGSGLKQTSTLANGAESLELLDKLIGASTESKTHHDITDKDISQYFDFGGLSLRDLALADESTEPTDEEISIPVSQSPEDFDNEKAKYEDLHRSIRACDDILGSVETNLTNFRNDLASVSSDIESLQARSTALNVRLENRKAVEKGLGPVVEDLSVSPIVISRISEGHIDEAWVRTLADLDKRATAYKKNSINQEQNKAIRDLGPLLEKLTLKAIERIRDFFVAQIKALRSPHINAQIIQQQHFLRFKDLFSFLYRHHDTLGDEICLAYMNTMRWYYSNQFGRYEKALEKIKLHNLDKNDVLGYDESARRTSVLSGPSVLSGVSRVPGPPHDAFSLGHRIDLLKTSNSSALPSYLAEEDYGTHYLEMPFRNFNLALIDNCTAEYTFLASFFSPALSLAIIGKHFNYIFETTFTMGQALTKRLVSETYDALGLLLSIRLNQHFAFELQRRRVPAADSYVNGTTMLLWPRLQIVMSHHCDSIRNLTNSLPNKPSSSVAKTINTAPHVMTQRFGNLLHGILTLSQEAGDDEPVVTSLRRLRAEVEAFLTKYSTGFGNDRRKRERLLYNNYSLILTIISDTTGKLADEQQSHFEGLKLAFQENS
ncbi:hypothetical protein MKZ38_000342 [Zalerion maritima]|uniref:Uncharacterized protein n=1 Tax=Zalerion maritima TaxID=339359 RepID=A0AAD5WTS2_9PEZI|nr:hypothetical protein MKZ38_000342 [Zalerion maritima]